MRDPVCNMEVKAPAQFKKTHNGKTYEFCSRGCETEFEKNPQKYAK